VRNIFAEVIQVLVCIGLRFEIVSLS